MTVIPEKPFKSLGEVKAEIRRCDLMGTIFSLLCLVCASIGIVSDILEMALVLEAMSWLLLAIIFAVNAVLPAMHSVAAKHLFGIEAERREKE